jgi:hypothetical protein
MLYCTISPPIIGELIFGNYSTIIPIYPKNIGTKNVARRMIKAPPSLDEI